MDKCIIISRRCKSNKGYGMLQASLDRAQTVRQLSDQCCQTQQAIVDQLMDFAFAHLEIQEEEAKK